jgi:hypothetical protein
MNKMQLSLSERCATGKEYSVVIVDNVDPDNMAAALAATSAELRLDTAAVIVTGRPVHTNPNAQVTEHEPAESARVRLLNTRRMAGFLLRAGRDVPVFEGSIAPETIVPHAKHIDERKLDLYKDEENKTPVSGNLSDALDFIEELDGTVHVIAGGPLTDVEKLMRRPGIYTKLGNLSMQLASFGLLEKHGIRSYAGGRRQFNHMCDRVAAAEVISHWPGSLFMVPTDITKHPAVAHKDIEELKALSLQAELTEVYEAAFHEMESFRRGGISIHDIHPVFLMSRLLHSNASSSSDLGFWAGEYFARRVDPDWIQVSSQEISFPTEAGIANPDSDRYIITAVFGNPRLKILSKLATYDDALKKSIAS